MLLHLLQVELRRYLDPFLDVLFLETTAGQDDECLGQFGRGRAGERNIFSFIEMRMQDFALFREVLEHVFEMLHAVADVPRFILHHQAENFLVHVGRRQIFAEAEQGQHVAFRDQMQRD